MPVVQDYIKYTKNGKRIWRKDFSINASWLFRSLWIEENDGTISGSNISDFSNLCDMLIAKSLSRR